MIIIAGHELVDANERDKKRYNATDDGPHF